MPSRVAESVVRRRLLGRPVRVRIELHGVSLHGPGDQRQIMRWEWVDSVEAVAGGVLVAGDGKQLLVPAGAFGLAPADLAALLRQAGDIDERIAVMDRLNGLTGDAPLGG